MMKIDTRISTIEQLENSIIRVEIKPNIIPMSSDLDENYKVYHEKLRIDKGLFLLVFNAGSESNFEVREKYANSKRAEIKKAEALVITTLSHRIESNFYKRRFKPNHPVKVFTNEKAATDWLLTIKCNQELLDIKKD